MSEDNPEKPHGLDPDSFGPVWAVAWRAWVIFAIVFMWGASDYCTGSMSQHGGRCWLLSFPVVNTAILLAPFLAIFEAILLFNAFKVSGPSWPKWLRLAWLLIVVAHVVIFFGTNGKGF